MIPRRAGFTLIETLVVVAIIVVLAGMLLPVLSMIRFQAKALGTQERIDDVLRELAQVGTGSQNAGPAVVLMRDAGLGGVLGYDTDPRNLSTSSLTPAEGAWLSAAPHHFRWPWGQPGRDPLSGQPLAATSGPVAKQECSHRLSELSPLRTFELLRSTAVLPADDPATASDERLDAVRGDRGANRPWNDRWGHPLVIAFAVYQPVKGGEVAWALQQYQMSRAVYLSGGSAGPVLDAPLPTTLDDAAWLDAASGAYAQLWSQINAVCNRVGGEDVWRTDFTVWNASTPPVNSFANPPWQGVRRVRDQSRAGFLSTPIEVK